MGRYPARTIRTAVSCDVDLAVSYTTSVIVGILADVSRTPICDDMARAAALAESRLPGG